MVSSFDDVFRFYLFFLYLFFIFFFLIQEKHVMAANRA
jgi:hypothetical protein